VCIYICTDIMPIPIFQPHPANPKKTLFYPSSIPKALKTTIPLFHSSSLPHPSRAAHHSTTHKHQPRKSNINYASEHGKYIKKKTPATFKKTRALKSTPLLIDPIIFHKDRNKISYMQFLCKPLCTRKNPQNAPQPSPNKQRKKITRSHPIGTHTRTQRISLDPAKH
jgi:hypothetical protein